MSHSDSQKSDKNSRRSKSVSSNEDKKFQNYETELSKIKDSVVHKYDLSSIEDNFQSASYKNLNKLMQHLQQVADLNSIVISSCRKESKTVSDNSMSTSTTGKKGKDTRASKYRGVSKNGPKWQVLFMGHKKKEYVGSINSEQEAAKIYDEISIKANGLKVTVTIN